MYLYYIKIKVLESLTYKYEFFITIIKQFFFIFVTALFWRALYANVSEPMEVSVEDMLIYSVISVFLQNFFSRSVEGELRNRIRTGNISLDYLKPINMFGMMFANDVGNIIVNLVQRFLPVLVFSMIFIVVPLTVSGMAFILFVISTLMSFFILWNISAIFGLLYFWMTDTGDIGGVKEHIINLLSGALIPIWFFPKTLQTVLDFLPFVYTYQLPISIFIGKLSVQEAIISMGIQLLWCAVFFGIFILVSKRALKNIMIQGG